MSLPVRAPQPAAPRTVPEAAAWLRRSLLPQRPASRRRIGVEYELLVLEAETHRPALWSDGAGPLARWIAAHARVHGWQRLESGKGAPRWRLPDGDTVTFEPGGQLEYASCPFPAVAPLLARLEEVIEPLHASARAYGLVLLARGIDPYNPITAAPLQFHSARYAAMDAYFSALGPAGARMMRQTASLQVNIDATRTPDAAWRLANALVPFLCAAAANSSVYAGAPARHASERALTWQALDPLRTGVLPGSVDPAAEYARFALDAPAMLLDRLPFGARADRTETEWEEHLSTLFPEVRPRGYLEIRCMDAVPLERAATLVRALAGLFWHEAAFREAAEIAGAPDPALLGLAGRRGMADAGLRRRTERLLALGLAAVAELEPGE